MKKIFAILFCAGFFAGFVKAQVFPPEFICVKNDSLFWELPSNTCGSFNSYEIYGSQNPNGPFMLLATVTDPAQTLYFHSNPTGVLWYFYLLSNFDCPGETAIPSDTLDNRPPEVSPIQYVTVSGNEVQLSWQASPSPEVFAYIVYRETPVGLVPIDTVFSGSTYTDQNADPQQQSESYFVNALDRCGNASIFDTKHSTIFLEAEPSACRQSIMLSWNTYESWPNGVAEQQIWVGENGGQLEQVETLGSNIKEFEFENLVDGASYCFVIKTVEALTATESASNQVCVTADIIQAVNELYLLNVTVDLDGAVEVSWGWNNTAEVAEVQLQSSGQNANYLLVHAVSNIPQPPLLQNQGSLTDSSGAALQAKVFYRIQTTDLCDTVNFSGYGSTIFLSATSGPGNVNRLTWTPFDLENSMVDSYTIYKVLNGQSSEIGTVGADITTFDAVFEPTNPEDAASCYFVVAHHTVTAPNGQEIAAESQSNTYCIEQDVRILTPNAFVPEGFNTEFKPLLVFDNLVAYEMHIFDRYGQQMFYSNNPDDGWNGEKNGKPMPQGVYVFLIKATQPDGSKVEKKGTLLLVR